MEDEKEVSPEVEAIFAGNRTDRALEMSRPVAALIPAIGGLLTEILSRERTDRQERRLGEFLTDLAARVKKIESPEEEFVGRDEFKELFEETMAQVAEERSESKRKIYADFLVGHLDSPGEIDDSFKMLRLLESFEPVHVVVLKGLMQDPPAEPRYMGSPGHVLSDRTGLDGPKLREAVEELNALRLTKLDSLNVTMTGRGAEELQHTVTPLGQRLIRYVVQGEALR